MSEAFHISCKQYKEKLKDIFKLKLQYSLNSHMEISGSAQRITVKIMEESNCYSLNY